MAVSRRSSCSLADETRSRFYAIVAQPPPRRRTPAIARSLLDVLPEDGQVQLEGFEGRANLIVVVIYAQRQPLARRLGREAQHLQSVLQGIDQPGVGHAGLGVKGNLLAAVVALGGRRKNLAHPV